MLLIKVKHNSDCKDTLFFLSFKAFCIKKSTCHILNSKEAKYSSEGWPFLLSVFLLPCSSSASHEVSLSEALPIVRHSPEVGITNASVSFMTGTFLHFIKGLRFTSPAVPYVALPKQNYPLPPSRMLRCQRKITFFRPPVCCVAKAKLPLPPSRMLRCQRNITKLPPSSFAA